MLPLLHFQRYQEFQGALKQLQTMLDIADGEKTELREGFQNVQQLFQHQIVTLSTDELDSDCIPRWQSLQTEIYKQMRLLQTDMMLLQAARNPATSQHRISGLRDRINTLIKYCQALLQL